MGAPKGILTESLGIYHPFFQADPGVSLAALRQKIIFKAWRLKPEPTCFSFIQ